MPRRINRDHKSDARKRQRNYHATNMEALNKVATWIEFMRSCGMVTPPPDIALGGYYERFLHYAKVELAAPLFNEDARPEPKRRPYNRKRRQVAPPTPEPDRPAASSAPPALIAIDAPVPAPVPAPDALQKLQIAALSKSIVNELNK